MDIRRLHTITTLATDAQARARALFRHARNISSQRRLQWIASELYEVERAVRRGADQVTQTAAADVEWLLAFYLSELRRAEDALGQHPQASMITTDLPFGDSAKQPTRMGGDPTRTA